MPSAQKINKESKMIADITLEEKLDNLSKKLDVIKDALSRVTVLTGHGNILQGYGIKRWEPSKKHMNKYKI